LSKKIGSCLLQCYRASQHVILVDSEIATGSFKNFSSIQYIPFHSDKAVLQDYIINLSQCQIKTSNCRMQYQKVSVEQIYELPVTTWVSLNVTKW